MRQFSQEWNIKISTNCAYLHLWLFRNCLCTSVGIQFYKWVAYWILAINSLWKTFLLYNIYLTTFLSIVYCLLSRCYWSKTKSAYMISCQKQTLWWDNFFDFIWDVLCQSKINRTPGIYSREGSKTWSYWIDPLLKIFALYMCWIFIGYYRAWNCISLIFSPDTLCFLRPERLREIQGRGWKWQGHTCWSHVITYLSQVFQQFF